MPTKLTFGQRVKAFFGNIGWLPNISWYSPDQLPDIDYSDKANQLKANLGWVFAANDVIAEECASVPLKLVRVNKKDDDEEVFDHELLDLINNPNAVLTSKQFWSLYFSYLNLTGEVYILKLDRAGNPLEDSKVLPAALYPLPSHLCQFKLGERSYDESTVIFNGHTYSIKAILRDIVPNPENFTQGMSVVQKSALTIDTDYQMKRWNNKMFKNNARPGAVISFPNALSDNEFKRAKQIYAEQTAGTDNAFKNLIMDNGATVTPYMMSAQDLDFLASKAFTRDEILAMFKVSKSSLGIVDDVNRANNEAQEYGFRKRCVVPRLEQLKDFLNARLVKPIYGDEYEIDFGDILPEDTEAKLKEAEVGVNKWLTIDEVRERYDMEPLPDGLGAEIYTGINQVPLSAVKENAEADISGADGGKDEEKPADGSTNDDDGKDGGEDGSKPEDASEGEKDAKNGKKKDEDLRQKIGNEKAVRYDQSRVKYTKQITRVSRVMFNHQKEDALKWLDENADKIKGFKLTKGWADEIIDWKGYEKQFAKDVRAILAYIIEEIGEQEFARIVGDGEKFDPKTAEINIFLETTANENSIAVNRETEKQIKATLKEGIAGGESTNELKARVESVFGTASTQRAYKIALTESAIAQNYADVQAWKQSGVVVAKEWFTAEDATVCGWCAEMDGKQIPLDDDFFEKGDWFSYTDHNGKEHSCHLNYRDIGEPPLHPECRCVLLPVMGQ